MPHALWIMFTTILQNFRGSLTWLLIISSGLDQSLLEETDRPPSHSIMISQTHQTRIVVVRLHGWSGNGAVYPLLFLPPVAEPNPHYFLLHGKLLWDERDLFRVGFWVLDIGNKVCLCITACSRHWKKTDAFCHCWKGPVTLRTSTVYQEQVWGLQQVVTSYISLNIRIVLD